jgi:23S rRNA (adenine2030-N6)-methyltransferase
MQYRHSFHAGNFADVHKHVALVALISALQKKAKGFFYLDTHAGAGLYDLRGEASRRGAEAASGIGRVEQAALEMPLRAAEITAWLTAVGRVRSTAGSTTYPGSPLLAAAALRDVDRGCCVEAISQEARHLSRSLTAIAPLIHGNIRVETGDGYQQLSALLPPKERRALVLIDPPYESSEELARVAEALPGALDRFDSGVFAVWYPIKRQRDIELWHEKLARILRQPTLAAQLWLHPRDTAVGLNGSGLILVNPPWQMDARLALWQEELRQLLGGGSGSGSDVKWIIHEPA